jgi:hypothetical protein
METSQGNSLSNCHYLKQAKMSFLSFFFFYKIEEQERGTSPAWELGIGRGWCLWEGEVLGKGCRRVTVVQLFTRMCKCKNDTF